VLPVLIALQKAKPGPQPAEPQPEMKTPSWQAGRFKKPKDRKDMATISSAENLGNTALCSGFGQFHSNESSAKVRKPYASITLAGIREMVDNPQAVDKADAQWLIPSELLSRVFKTQEDSGKFWLLWADLDDAPKSIAEVQDALICQVLDDCDHEVYTSKSATPERQKARIVIPLSKPLSGSDWMLAQEVFNDQLMVAGITPDRASERPAQLCYLPNRGQHYASLSQRGGVYFDPLTTWAIKIEAKRQALAAQAAALEAAREAARARREARQAARDNGARPALMDAFNSEYTPQDILIEAGYDQRGDSFRHPGSESGSYSASVKNGRVHALSSADPLYTGGGGGGAHDAFSCFQILMHGGDRDDAIKDAGNDWLKIGAEAWNAVVQREYAKAQADKAKNADWPDMADPFEQYAVPAFPVDTLPGPFATLCRELSAQSGFDVGGYAFSLLVGVSSLIDHRARMRAGPLSAPPFLWGGLVANSGGGKSPTISAALAGIRRINDALLTTSQRDSANWQNVADSASKEDRKDLVRPLWRQLIASDTTTEGLGKLLQDNASGVLLIHDELTEFIGRMDAYSGNGSGKDRGVYLRAYDGGSVTVNRAGSHPMLINNFSVGIMAGIQPEKLGELFRKSGGGADGLYQRFLMYVMQPAGRVDYSAVLGAFTETEANEIMDTMHFWTEFIGFGNARLCPEGLPLMEQYHQEARTVSQRTAGKRLAEHLDKFPGFLARITFALHYMEGAATGAMADTVSVATLERAKRIMRCLYHHGAAVYEVLDSHSSEATKLTKSACEAILSKAWSTVQRGDLTRHATDWRNADDRQAEGAIDCLIEFGWLRDVTPALERGKRGRRSNGVFLVNPKVHQRFSGHAQRISESRNARFKAIKELAATR